MAQHDYVIDNSTGANVRADINSALQAIATNNSGSSAPSATFPSQFFADTSAGIMKLRNTSDNGYVNLFTLAGGIDVDAASNFNEDVTFTGASANIVFDKSDNQLEFADNAKAEFGTGGDLEIYHDGSDSFIKDLGTGSLILNTNEFQVRSADNSERLIKGNENGAVELYHDNVKYFETNSTGTKTLGNHIFNGTNNFLQWVKSSDLLRSMDGVKVTFGNSDDLQIFHDGSNSFIKDAGTGVLHLDTNGSKIQIFADGTSSKTMGNFIREGAVELYHDGSKKFETTAFGITAQSSGDFQFKMFGNGGNEWGIFNQDNNLRFMEDSNERMRISAGGNIGAPTGSNIYNASDFRLKKNVETIENALTSIKQLRPVSFNWIDGFCDSEKNTLYGFIAQEVETVDNNLIEKFGEGDIDLDGKIIKNPLRVNEKFIIPMLVRAIQELESKVAALETV